MSDDVSKLEFRKLNVETKLAERQWRVGWIATLATVISLLYFFYTAIDTWEKDQEFQITGDLLRIIELQFASSSDDNSDTSPMKVDDALQRKAIYGAYILRLYDDRLIEPLVAALPQFENPVARIEAINSLAVIANREDETEKLITAVKAQINHIIKSGYRENTVTTLFVYFDVFDPLISNIDFLNQKNATSVIKTINDACTLIQEQYQKDRHIDWEEPLGIARSKLKELKDNRDDLVIDVWASANEECARESQ